MDIVKMLGLGREDATASPRVYAVKGKVIRDLIAAQLAGAEAVLPGYRDALKRGDKTIPWADAIDTIEKDVIVAKVALDSVQDGPHVMSFEELWGLHKQWSPWRTADQIIDTQVRKSGSSAFKL